MILGQVGRDLPTEKYTIAIVTHNLQQAKRTADPTVFLYVDTTQGGHTGYLVEFGPIKDLSGNPRERHTQDYIAGAFSCGWRPCGCTRSNRGACTRARLNQTPTLK